MQEDNTAEIIEDIDTPEETQEDNSEDTTTPKEPDKVTFSPEQQNLVDDIIGGKIRKTREAESHAADLQKQLDDIEAAKPKSLRPEVPPIIDPYDENYEDKVKARDEALQKAATYDQEQSINAHNAQLQQDNLIKDQQKEVSNAISSYSDTAVKLGVSQEVLTASANKLTTHALNNDAVAFILSHDVGPVITKYLADNIVEVDKLNGMNAMQQAAYIEATVVPLAKEASKIGERAPAPADTLDGAGVESGQRGPAGARFE